MKGTEMNIGHYAKTLLQIAAAGALVFLSAWTDHKVTPIEYVNIGLAVLAAIGVYYATTDKFLKAIFSAVGAALQALALLLAPGFGWDHVSQSDWITVVLSGLAAVGVGVIPNTPKFSLTKSSDPVQVAAHVSNIANLGATPLLSSAAPIIAPLDVPVTKSF